MFSTLYIQVLKLALLRSSPMGEIRPHFMCPFLIQLLIPLGLVDRTHQHSSRACLKVNTVSLYQFYVQYDLQCQITHKYSTCTVHTEVQVIMHQYLLQARDVTMSSIVYPQTDINRTLQDLQTAQSACCVVLVLSCGASNRRCLKLFEWHCVHVKR